MESTIDPAPLVAGLEDSVLFVGGRLCLDFVNSLCNRLGKPLEILADVDSLGRWLELAAGFYGDVSSSWSVADGERTLARAVELRAVLRNLVGDILEHREPSVSTLEALNSFLKSNATFPLLAFEDGSFRQIANASNEDPWLAAIAKDAVDMLCHADLRLLKQCEHETCIRVFFDTTKNHTRRWCVERCGSRVKAKNYYRRKRERETAKAE